MGWVIKFTKIIWWVIVCSFPFGNTHFLILKTSGKYFGWCKLFKHMYLLCHFGKEKHLNWKSNAMHCEKNYFLTVIKIRHDDLLRHICKYLALAFGPPYYKTINIRCRHSMKCRCTIRYTMSIAEFNIKIHSWHKIT